MNQYLGVKREYPDAILLFRLGDFYEMFYDDAKIASEILGIALTSRDRSKKNPVPLCGVPFHSVEPHISKLLGSGKKVAICEQVGDPKQAKGIVDRKVVRVLTPGVVLDSENLESKSNNFLACVAEEETVMRFASAISRQGSFEPLFFARRRTFSRNWRTSARGKYLSRILVRIPSWLKSLLDSNPARS